MSQTPTRTGTSSSVVAADAEAREKAFGLCDRFLFGHGLHRPRAVLAELVEEAGSGVTAAP